MKYKIAGIVSFVVAAAFMFSGANITIATGSEHTNNTSDCILKMSVDYMLPAFQTSSCGQYDSVSISGLYNGGPPGHPALPQKGITLLLPFGYKFKSASASGTPVNIDGTYLIKPSSKPVPISLETTGTTPKNPAIYSSGKLYPDNPFTYPLVQGFRGYSILMATLYPIQYVPLSGELYYYPHLRVTLELEQGDSGFTNLYRGLPQDVSDVTRMVDDPQVVSSYPNLAQPCSTYDLLIICKSSFKSAFQKLADWKNNQTFVTRIASVEDIESSSPGNDTQEKIRNYIINEYKSNGISYVILGGDTGSTNVPHRELYCNDGGMSDNIPCDLYYSGLDGTWDKNGNGQYGEDGEEDYEAEVYVGRLPADTASDVTVMVNKIISFETNERPKDITLHGSYADSGSTPIKDVKEGYSGTGDIGCHDYIPTTYTVHTLYEPDNGTITSTQWEDEFKAGRLVINHCGHGMYTEYMLSYYPSSVTYGASEASALTNTIYPVQSTVACMVGGFDYDDCLAEAFVLAPNGGCSACVMNARYGLYGGTGDAVKYSGELDIEYFKQMFGNKITNLGKAVQMARQTISAKGSSDAGYKWVTYCWNLFGDPTQDMLGTPKIHITSPNGGENWYSNTQHDILWSTSGGVGTLNVKLEYSTAGSTGPWILIQNGLPDTGKFNWTVPPVMSTNCFVKATVNDSSTPPRGATDLSDAAFTITQPHQINLTQPNGGECLAGGSSYQIKWTTTGGTGLKIDIFYSNDSGANFISVATGQSDTGSYTWTVPTIDCTTVKVRVKAINSIGLYVNDTSDSDFMIDSSAPVVGIVSPTAGNMWTEGTHRLMWSVSELVGLASNSLNISYSPDDGATWAPPIISSQSSVLLYYDWNLPADSSFDSASARIKVSVFDRIGRTGEKVSEKFTIDTSKPVITHSPVLNAAMNSAIKITATVTDNLALQSVLLYYTNVGGATFTQLTMTGSGTTYSADIPAQTTAGNLKYHIIASDTVNHYVIDPVLSQTPSMDNNYTVEIKDAKSTGIVSGTVSTAGGSPIASASVSAMLSGSVMTSATTNINGFYKLSGLDPETYDLVANASGYSDGHIDGVVVAAGDDLTKDFTLLSVGGSDKRSISGTVVTDSDQQPIEGATVQLLLSGTVVDTKTTIANGSFLFSGLDSASYTLNVSKQGYNGKTEQVSVVSGNKYNVEISLSGGGGINNDDSSTVIMGLPVMWFAIIIGVIIVLIILSMIAAMAAGRKRRKEEEKQKFVFPYPPPTHNLQSYLNQYDYGPDQQPYYVNPGAAPPPPMQPHYNYSPQPVPPPTTAPPMQYPPSGKMKVCRRCGYSNETWRLSCTNCKSNLGGH